MNRGTGPLTYRPRHLCSLPKYSSSKPAHRPHQKTCLESLNRQTGERLSLPKAVNKTPITDPKEIEICELADKEFKIIILKNPGELWKNTDKQLSKYQVNNTWMLVSCTQPGLVICFTLDNIHVSMLFSWNIPPSPSPTESKILFYTSVSLFLFCI